MSKTILLRFGTKNLDKAKTIAERIRRRMLEATAEGSKARALAEKVLGANQAVIDAADRRAQELAARGELRQRGRGLRQRGIDILRGNFRGERDAPNQLDPLSPIAGRALAGVGAAQALLGPNRSAEGLLIGAAYAASFVGGPAGMVVQAVTMAFAQIKPYVDRETEKVRQALQDEIAGINNRIAEQQIGEERLRSDPDFALQQARRLGAILRAQPEARWLNGPASPGGLSDL